MRMVPWLIALFALVAASVVIVAAAFTPNPRFPGLARIEQADYTNTYSGQPFQIRCEAWTNQPDRDFKQEPDRTWLGVRYVRDCTIEPAKGP